MKDFIREFNKRVAEINKYFELVDRIEELGLPSTNLIIFPSGEYTVDSELQKILKSHCYLLLYNLIESSIRNGIIGIHDAILMDQLTYRDLSEKIQKLWLLNDQSKSFIASNIKKETIANNLQDTIRSVIKDEIVTLDPTNIPISGNLDAKTIKKLIDLYGFHGNLGVPDKEIDDILNFIVKIRCDLAHGNVSFCDASNQFSWKKSGDNADDHKSEFRYLIDHKENIVQYLTHLLQNINDYIDNKKYKKS